MYTDKSHIIVLLSVNSTGIGKLQQLVIGHSKRLGYTLSDTEIVEMVLEDAQIEGGANVDSDEDSEEPPPRLKKLMDL
ncbi:16296_t:CDS:2 [Entrophospora sp. SA101]|nr:16296_t:CDS:2 [Entrophospora sp. SA101]